MEQQSVIDAQDMIAARRRASEVTTAHIGRVMALMSMAAETLRERGMNHDKSKMQDAELLPLARMQMVIDQEGQAPYGSDEYKRRTAMLGPMLDHHYANNSHHPEHYENGVNGMDLFDVVEMFFDWKAASERGGEDAMNLSYSIEKFGIEAPLSNVLYNTAERLGYRTK